MQFDDRELIEAAKANPEAYEPLYSKYMERIYTYFWFRVGYQKEIAEDCMQETFVRAFRHVSDFTDKGVSYLSYLLTIAHNLLVNHYRWSQTNRAVSLEDVDEAAFDYAQDFMGSLDSQCVWRAVSELSEIERDVLLLRFSKGLSMREIAFQKGKTENAIKLLVSRAKKKLARNPALADYVVATVR